MDVLWEKHFTSHFYGNNIHLTRQPHLSTTERSRRRKLNSTLKLVAVSLLMVSLVTINAAAAAEITSSFWDTDEVTELKILKCIFEIHKGAVANAIKIFDDLNEYTNYYLIYMIIKRGYDNNIKNMHRLIDFIVKLPWCNHQYAGFDYLFDELKLAHQLHSHESIQFAFRLKKFLDGNQTCQHKNDNKNLVKKLEDLRKEFPEVTKQIVWKKSKTCLKNVQYNEEIYVAECCEYDNERRRLFTWIPKGEIGIHGEWTFEPVNDVASVFWIKSDRYQEYVYAAECCKYDVDRRNVFTWKPKTDIGPLGEWVPELKNGSNTFRIRNNYYDEYLYAAECCAHDQQRRSVFTWIPKGDIGVHGEWQITSCRAL